MNSHYAKILSFNQQIKSKLEKEIATLIEEQKKNVDRVSFLLKHIQDPLKKHSKNGELSSFIICKDLDITYPTQDGLKLINEDIEKSSLFLDHEVERVLIDTEIVIEEELCKKYNVEGKVGLIAYSLQYTTKHNVVDEVENEIVESIENIKLSRKEEVLHNFIDKLKEGSSISCLYLGLSTLQHLENERLECIEQLEQVPDLVIESLDNEFILNFQATSQHEIVINWKVLSTVDFTKPYFRHVIDVDCSDETMMRFSRSKAYKILANEELLLSKKDVINFFDIFSK